MHELTYDSSAQRENKYIIMYMHTGKEFKTN
jgi:hypothetical protein